MRLRAIPLAVVTLLALATANVVLVAAQTARPRSARDTAPQEAMPVDEAARIGVRRTAPFGAHLVDANGHALYSFTADRPGHSSACDAECAHAFPPLLTRGAPVPRAKIVRDRLLGLLQRREGAMQVTYDGWPLYRFVRDESPGEARGQGIQSFGGGWYLVAPEGNRIGEPTPAED